MKSIIRPSWILLTLICSFSFSTAFAQSPSYYTVSGDVRDEFGRPASGINVCAFPEQYQPGKGVICGQSDENGLFIIRLASPGKYTMFPEKSLSGYMPQNRPFYRHSSAVIPEVRLDDNTRDLSVSVILSPKSGVIAGKIMDAQTNLPVDDVRITMCRVDDPKACFSTSAKDSKGKFKVMASLVPFSMRFTADGYEDWLGANGLNEPMNLGSGDTMELDVYLKRRKDTVNAALNEAEKQAGVNLPAPVQLSPKPDAEFNHYPRSTKLEWEAVEGASSYTVEVDFCHGIRTGKPDCINPQPHTMKGNPETTRITSTSYEFDFVGAQPGRWRVWAIDKEGREGFKSEWRKFFYQR